MKYLIVSDVHGSYYYTKKLKEIIEVEKPNKVILLGDLYYHGPRNELPKEYSPKDVCNYFNSIKDKLIAIKGNCDAEVDEMISDFKIKKSFKFKYNNKLFFLSHGHKYNEDNFPNTPFDVMIYGHYHTGFIKTKNSKVIANAGSLSLPKNDTENSYLTIENGCMFLKNLKCNIIDSVKI